MFHTVCCLFIKIFGRNFILVMIEKNDSVANILNSIISKIEVELEQKSSLRASQSELEDVTKSEKKLSRDSVEDINCRICYDPSSELSVIYPCRCKGTMGAIHLKCLERWLEEGNRDNCELCGHVFRVERTPRYKALRSVTVWLCLNQNEHQIYVRNVKADLLRCLIVIPVTIACSYVCIVAADFYATNNYDNFPPARWTTCSLLSMMALLILSFFVWIYMTLQYHQKAWFYWWQKTSSVKIIDLMPGNIALRNDKRDVSQV
ncbi:E3 ubiquitin-protein ligase MARCH3-like [Pogonomyrmex barbatus]|uniref:E3 ubiquitin-protein ligase MARCH3-like n=1 Tax=Pogonomyrmex barbatus TaxID=144034 RepID=A0A6I9WHN1_9HYME|nr:E3 ubiquitin-protein ligase MARCH3-like [Pogonomyrmex barbatus]